MPVVPSVDRPSAILREVRSVCVQVLNRLDRSELASWPLMLSTIRRVLLLARLVGTTWLSSIRKMWPLVLMIVILLGAARWNVRAIMLRGMLLTVLLCLSFVVVVSGLVFVAVAVGAVAVGAVAEGAVGVGAVAVGVDALVVGVGVVDLSVTPCLLLIVTSTWCALVRA